MQQVTRGRPRKKKSAQKKVMAARNRHKRREAREHQRKLKRKLCQIIDKIGYGYYSGVRESPLLRANWHYAMRILKRRMQLPGVRELQ